MNTTEKTTGKALEKQPIKMGFEPVYNEHSKVLILGSFPSVKSREISFYYGNKQNRFWKMLCRYFGEEIPPSVEGKKDFLLRRNVALWDMISVCQIEGSSDSSIRGEKVVDLRPILEKAPIRKILLNGSLAYKLFENNYAGLGVDYAKMPSTSPANPRYDEKIWKKAFDGVFYAP